MKRYINHIIIATTLLLAIQINAKYEKLIKTMLIKHRCKVHPDETLQQLFTTLKQQLKIPSQHPLFSHKQHCYGQYFPSTKAISIEPRLARLTTAQQRFVLFHELRHYMQFKSTSESDQIVRTLLSIQKSKHLDDPDKVIEYDADLFATKKLQHCWKCLQEVKRLTYSSLKQKGYMPPKDYDPFIQRAQNKDQLCKDHKK